MLSATERPAVMPPEGRVTVSAERQSGFADGRPVGTDERSRGRRNAYAVGKAALRMVNRPYGTWAVGTRTSPSDKSLG